MSSAKVAKRYARALLELAVEQNQLEPWGAELTQLAEFLSAPEVAEHLMSPQVSEPARLEAVTKVAERLGLSYPLRSFAVVVARHGRVADIRAVSQSYQQQLDERLGRVRATLTFASEPSASEVATVVAGLEQVSGKKVIPTVKVDRELLGGVVAELEGRIYDASLATRLQAAERQLSE